jgi:thiamine biosynthesis lipoprotein
MMDMPITIEIADKDGSQTVLDTVYSFFKSIDERFSTFKVKSEISQINNGSLPVEASSEEMQTIFKLCEQTKKETHGFFDIHHAGTYDPSGLVKGWAIFEAAKLLHEQGYTNYYVDAGGDIQTAGLNTHGEKWKVGIRNPFNRQEVVKVIELSGQGVATSGTYIRGQHVYNPFQPNAPITDIVSLTIIGPNVYEADRFATAAFAMGSQGIQFVSQLSGFEGYVIDAGGRATYTGGFNAFVLPS